MNLKLFAWLFWIGGLILLAEGWNHRVSQEVAWGGLVIALIGAMLSCIPHNRAKQSTVLDHPGTPVRSTTTVDTIDENSESAPLVFCGRLTEDDIVDLQWCYDHFMLRRSIRWFARGFLSVMTGLLVWSLVAIGPTVIVILGLLVCLYLLFVQPRERVWTIRRRYRRQSADFLETEMRLTPDRVSIHNDDISYEMVWKRIAGLVETQTGILFLGVMIWLPARILEPDDLRAKVLALARRNHVPVSKV